MSNYERVLITGANRGIGLALATRLAQDCKELIATCRSPDEASQLRELAQHHGQLTVRALDVTNHDQVDDLAEELAGRPLDLLLNNAGYYGPKPQQPTDLAQWRQVLEVNTLAPIYLASRLMPSIAASKRRLIVNLSSKVGSMADNQSGGSILYRSSKAALNAATRSLAIDHRAEGVIAFVVHPGWVQTEMGGPGALIDVETSAGQLVDLIGKADQSCSGGFFDRDGSTIAW